MNNCPNCGQTVLQMAKQCRHCGTELDEATFFLNEAEMVAEIMALKKEADDKAASLVALHKAAKIRGFVAALLLLVGGVLLAAASTNWVQGAGAILGGAGVLLSALAIRARRQREALKA